MGVCSQDMQRRKIEGNLIRSKNNLNNVEINEQQNQNNLTQSQNDLNENNSEYVSPKVLQIIINDLIKRVNMLEEENKNLTNIINKLPQNNNMKNFQNNMMNNIPKNIIT